MSRAELIATRALAVMAGISIWLSLGALAVTEDDSRMRLVAVPGWWVLVGAVAVPSAIVWWRRPRWQNVSPLAISGLLWLPFVPGAIPAAFLIWHGPVAIGVWLFVATGLVLVNAGGAPRTGRFLDPRTAPWIAALAAIAAFTAGAAALSSRLPIGDEPHYLMITQSVLKDGDLKIENNHKNRDYAAFSRIDIPPHYLARGRDGEIYSSHAPGTSFIVLPAFALFGYYGAVATVLLCVAAASALAWSTAWKLTGAAGAAWLTWAAIFMTTPVFLHAITVFPDGLATLPVMAATWLLATLDSQGTVRRRALIAVGAALATVPWLHTRLAIAAAALGLAIVLREIKNWKRVLWFLSVPAVSAAAWFGFFWLFWGTPSPFAPWGSGVTARWQWIPRGVTGLLLDQQAGLIPSAPAYGCAMAGWFILFRHRRRLAIEIAVVGCLLAASVASYDTWWGGQGGPARFIVAVLPLAVPAFAVLAGSPNRWRHDLAAVSVIASMMLLVARVAVDHGAHTFYPEGGTNPVLAWLTPSVDLSGALPSLTVLQGQHFAAVDNLHGLVLGAMWALPALAVVALFGLLALQRGDQFTAAVLASASIVMVAASVVWHSRGESGLLPFASAEAFLQTWVADRLPIDFQWRRPYLTSPATIARRLELRLRPGQPVSLPAGLYEVWVDQPLPAAGSQLRAMLGDSSLPLARWPVDPKAATGPMALRLPLRVESLRFEIDQGARASAIRLRLAAPPQNDIVTRAVRASGINDVRVFFVDNQAYAEPTGFWIPPGTATRLVVDRPDGPERPLLLRLRAGPIDSTVDLELDGQRSQVRLGAGQWHELQIRSTTAGYWQITIRPESGFRPIDFDPATHDERLLGIWVELL